MTLSREYYAVAPYHHDSAASRMYAVKLSETRRTQGLGAALREVLASRDSLEPTVRLLVAPGSLRRLRGHLVTCLPLLAAFLTLVAGYVWERSGSAPLALAATLLLPCFAYVHDPIVGPSDYWRESAAAWLFGSAIACWLSSDDLRRRGWGAACGAFLAALVLARTVVGVYAVLVLAPLVARVLPQVLGPTADRVRRGRLVRMLGLAASGALLTALLVGRKLYIYYAVTGWSYGGAGDVLGFLLPQVGPRLGLGVLAVALSIAVCWTLRRRPPPGRFWGDAAWLASGLPLIVAALGGFYHGTFALTTVLLVLVGACALATVHQPRRAIAGGLAVAAVALAMQQHRDSRRRALETAGSLAATRRFYQELTQGLLGANPAARYGLLFDAGETIFVNTAFFDRGIWPRGSVSFHTVVDTYYRQRFPGQGPQEAARDNLDALNARAGTLAAAFCTPDDVARSLPDQPFSRAAGTAASVALRDDPHWRAVRRLEAPAGCVLIYERSERTLGPGEKWAAVSGP